MRLGIICYASQTGLAYQSKEIYDHLNPAKTLLVDLSEHNQMPIDMSWYPDARYTRWPNVQDLEWLTDDVDVVLYCETPLNFELHTIANAKGVKVVQIYNYEFLDYFRQPELPKPSMLVAPTVWNIDRVRDIVDIPVDIWPVPVNRQRFSFREIIECKGFVHVVGRPAVHDRNGTLAFLDAVENIGDKFDYKVFIQTPKDYRAIQFFGPVLERLNQLSGLIEIVYDHHEPSYIYRSGDVLVLPRRYGGLCLPALEALSSGLPTIMTDISPNNDWLPKEWLCEAEFSHKFHDHQDTRYAHVNVDVFEPNVESLIETMLSFDDSTFMSGSNKQADQIAQQYSWDILKPIYEKKLCAL